MTKRPGRPEIFIDWSKLDGFLALGATLLDCSDLMDISEDTIERVIKKKHKLRFSEYREKKMSGMRIRLRQKQYDVAMKGNVTMLIWLGKQMLGQTDKVMTVDESDLEFVDE